MLRAEGRALVARPARRPHGALRCRPRPRAPAPTSSSWRRPRTACAPTACTGATCEADAAPVWLQDPAMLGYAAYTERFADDLRGIAQHLPYLDELGVRYLHLMPLLRPRDGDNDGGYAVADYRAVRPDLGTMDDLEDLACRLHRQRHEPGAGPRAQPRGPRARVGPARPCGRGDLPRLLPRLPRPAAARRRTSAPCPRSSPSSLRASFTWDDELRGWVWTTFNEFQWDVDWGNPAVLREYAAIILELANRGVDVLRLDAIAFMWKRLGTDCQGAARGARDHPGAARGHPDRLPGRGVPRRGDRRTDQAARLPRHRPVHRQGQRPRLRTTASSVQIWSMLSARRAPRRAGSSAPCYRSLRRPPG